MLIIHLKIKISFSANDKIAAPRTKAKTVVPTKIVGQPVKRKHIEESEIYPSSEPMIEMKSSSSSTCKSILKTAVSSAKIRVIAENEMIGKCGIILLCLSNKVDRTR